MADDNQQGGMSAQERLARLYNSRVDEQQGDATPAAGQVAGTRVSASLFRPGAARSLTCAPRRCASPGRSGGGYSG